MLVPGPTQSLVVRYIDFMVLKCQCLHMQTELSRISKVLRYLLDHDVPARQNAAAEVGSQGGPGS